MSSLSTLEENSALQKHDIWLRYATTNTHWSTNEQEEVKLGEHRTGVQAGAQGGKLCGHQVDRWGSTAGCHISIWLSVIEPSHAPMTTRCLMFFTQIVSACEWKTPGRPRTARWVNTGGNSSVFIHWFIYSSSPQLFMPAEKLRVKLLISIIDPRRLKTFFRAKLLDLTSWQLPADWVLQQLFL